MGLGIISSSTERGAKDVSVEDPVVEVIPSNEPIEEVSSKTAGLKGFVYAMLQFWTLAGRFPRFARCGGWYEECRGLVVWGSGKSFVVSCSLGRSVCGRTIRTDERSERFVDEDGKL